MARRADYVPLRNRVPHVVAIVEQCSYTAPETVPFELPIELQIERCRCGAWRARVLRGTRRLHTGWSAQHPSPAPARDDA